MVILIIKLLMKKEPLGLELEGLLLSSGFEAY
jgi:hypothetical protein